MILIFSIFLMYTLFFVVRVQNHAHGKGRQIVKGEKEIFTLPAGFREGRFCVADF